MANGDRKGEEEMQNNENDTVNMKCDLSHYLIAVKQTKLSVISEAEDKKLAKLMPEMEKEKAQQLGDDQIIAIKNSIREPPLKHKDNNGNVTEKTESEQQLKQSSSRINEEDQYQQPAQRSGSATSNFVQIAELLRLTQLESSIRQRAPSSCSIRLRLVGGGEDSINNGTSAWGTPAATNNPTGSTWGPIGGGGGGSAQQSNAAVGAPGGPQQQGVAGGVPPTTGAWGGAGQQNGGPGGQTSKNNAPPVNPNNVGASGVVAPEGSGSSGGNGGNGGAGGPWNGPGGNAQAPSASQGAPGAGVVAGNGNNAGGGGPQQDQQGVAAAVSQQQQVGAGAQAAGQSGQPDASGGGGASASGAAAAGAGSAVVQSSAAKNQLEHLNSLRESLFAQDGWGSENVDQDTLWEVPLSPEPGGKTDPNSATSGPMAGIPMWKTNTGTELWEANLRNGGQLPQQQPPVQKTPWGPANNYGGTWGEDDEANEPATGWNGSMGAAAGPGGPGVGMRDQPPGPQQSQQLAGQQQTQQPPWNSGGVAGAGVGAGTAGMWSGTGGGAPGGVGTMAPNVAAGLKKDNEWGSTIGAGAGAAGGSGAWGATGGGGGGGNAGGAADGRVGGNPVAAGGLDPTGLDMRNIRIASAMDSNREIRGDPRGISGRLNGNVGLWDQHQMSSMQQKMPPTATTPGTPTGGVGGQGGGNQWPSNNPLGSVNNGVAGGVGGGGAKLVAGSGWDDPNGGGGPPVVGGVRRNNMDDGTALWGQNALNRQNSGNVSGWNDNSGGGGGLGPPGTDGGMGRNMMHRNAMVGGGGNLPGNGGLVGRGVGPGGPMKPDSLWGQNPAAALGAGPRGGAGNWGTDDVPSGAGGNNWGDEKPPGGGMGGNSLWNDGNNWNNKGKMSTAGGGGGGWNDGTPGGVGSGPGGMDMGNSDWGMPQSKLPPNGNKMNTLEIIRCSKAYRQLCDMGFKKDDVEGVLRLTNMNVEESLELLHRSSAGGGSDWSRRPDGGHGGFGAGDQFVGGGGVSGRFAAAAAGVGPMAFPQNNQNLGGGVFGGGNGSAAGGGSFNSMKFGGGAGHGGAGGNGGGPVGGGGGGPPGAGAGVFGGQQQQQQQQQQPGALGGGGGGGGGGGLNQSNAQSQQISNHHLRLLVQQIQLAVQNGYLENQILNQPLAPQTLMLLNQLLTHIKQLNVMQNNLSRTGGGGGVNAVQMSIAINKLKSQIASLQNQINMQQANYLKQQQQQHQQHQQQPPHPGSLNAANVNVSAIAAGGGGNHPGTDLFRGPSDLTGLPGSFAEMALKESGGVPFPSSGNTSQQSRLQKWKLPPNSVTASGLDKDGSDLTDFVRAPGASSKSGPSGSGIDDGTWSNGRNNLGDGWPDSSSQDNKDWPGGNDAFSDLVPEFEPGKPWKGTQATRIEDDPTITPGSVARNPLSIAAAKESNLFGGGSGSGTSNSKSSPTESPWSFNPTSGVTGGGVQGGNYGGKVQKNPWQDPNTPTMPPADLWETPLGSGGNGAKGRGVGMMGGIGKAGGGKMDTNGWNTPSAQAGGSNTWNSGGPSANSWSSTWIMLKNLTAQIEGSTLRTLCLQHGPVVNFQLYLHHGIALCKYGTREEAQKAQLALNNCQLGNTTICAEIPNESDIQYILPHLVGTSNGMANGLTGGGGQNWRLSAAAQSQPMVGRSNSVVQDTWSSNSWGTGNTSSNLWNTLDGGPGDRGTPANLNSLLPESLLGTELN